MMRAPQLFAFVCHHPLNISLEGTVSEISSGTLGTVQYSQVAHGA